MWVIPERLLDDWGLSPEERRWREREEILEIEREFRIAEAWRREGERLEKEKKMREPKRK